MRLTSDAVQHAEAIGHQNIWRDVIIFFDVEATLAQEAI
jgi:hypothetical protein